MAKAERGEQDDLVCGGPSGAGAHVQHTRPVNVAVPSVPALFLMIDGGSSMAVKLNKRAFDHAKHLLNDDKVVFDERDAWSEHEPSAQKENEFIRLHGWHAYAR